MDEISADALRHGGFERDLGRMKQQICRTGQTRPVFISVGTSFEVAWHCDLPTPQALPHGSSMDEIIFKVREDEIDGGFVATVKGDIFICGE
jgi:hypothetical protein